MYRSERDRIRSDSDEISEDNFVVPSKCDEMATVESEVSWSDFDVVAVVV